VSAADQKIEEAKERAAKKHNKHKPFDNELCFCHCEALISSIYRSRDFLVPLAGDFFGPACDTFPVP
jgi:hypothetical protein